MEAFRMKKSNVQFCGDRAILQTLLFPFPSVTSSIHSLEPRNGHAQFKLTQNFPNTLTCYVTRKLHTTEIIQSFTNVKNLQELCLLQSRSVPLVSLFLLQSMYYGIVTNSILSYESSRIMVDINEGSLHLNPKPCQIIRLSSLIKLQLDTQMFYFIQGQSTPASQKNTT